MRRGLFADALFSCVQFTLIIQLMLHMRWDPYSDRNLNAVHCPTPYPTVLFCSGSIPGPFACAARRQHSQK